MIAGAVVAEMLATELLNASFIEEHS